MKVSIPIIAKHKGIFENAHRKTLTKEEADSLFKKGGTKMMPTKVWVRAFGHEEFGYACNTQGCPCAAEYVFVEEETIKNAYRSVYDCRCESCLNKMAPKCFKK